jgi:cation diffusion facilitator family transporter
MRAVYLHVLGDALGSVIVIISALIIKFAKGDWTLYVDPAMSILMTCLILRTSIPLMKESSLILLQTVPTHIKIKEVQERLLEQVHGILSIHEFHVWQLAGDKIIGEYMFLWYFTLSRLETLNIEGHKFISSMYCQVLPSLNKVPLLFTLL